MLQYSFSNLSAILQFISKLASKTQRYLLIWLEESSFWLTLRLNNKSCTIPLLHVLSKKIVLFVQQQESCTIHLQIKDLSTNCFILPTTKNQELFMTKSKHRQGFSCYRLYGGTLTRLKSSDQMCPQCNEGRTLSISACQYTFRNGHRPGGKGRSNYMDIG